MGALSGIRVCDFSWALAGPHATELLGYMGAEVIRIESMKQLDMTRKMVDPVTNRPVDINKSILYNAANLNKLSIRLNLKTSRGVELAKELVKISDVVVQSFTPGVIEKMGLSYDVLKEVKPDIIVLATSAFGATGPEAHYAAYAPMFAAYGGLGEMTGYPDYPPTEIRYTIDTISAVTNAFAILAALNYRQRTGKGQYIDISSTESISCLIGDSLMDYTMNHRVQSRNANRDDIMAPHNCYRCQGDDKWVSIVVATDEEWQALCNAMGNPEWTRDERFSDQHHRWQNQMELDKRITEWTKTHTDYEVMEILQKLGVAAMPSFSADELFSDPHLAERKFCQVVEHPAAGAQVMLNPPWKLSATPAEITRPSPCFGEHNDYVFGKLLGLSQEEILALEEEQVIY